MVDFKIEGLNELGKAIRELDTRLQRKVYRNSASAGARVIQRQAKANAPVLKAPVPHRNAGTVKKAIRVKSYRNRDGTFEARVWVKGIGRKKISEFVSQMGKSAALNPNDPYYWWWLEFGTAKMTAQPFMRPAFEQAKYEAALKTKEHLLKMLEKEASAVGREIGKV